MSANSIAIIGGGPAGAFAAAELARAGRKVILFDDKLAWEKPCGGGLTPKAVERWPFLRDTAVERNWITHCELIAPSGRKVRFALDRQITIFSRLTFNGLLLQRAIDAGVRVRRERVLDIGGTSGNWSIQTAAGKHEAGFVVLAAGARNSLRSRFTKPLGPEDSLLAFGYYVPGTHRTVQIRFLPGLHGYIWVFPRSDHFSVGICGRMENGNTSELRRILEDRLPEFGLSLEGARFYAHIIPCLTPGALRSLEFCGDGWAMIGDAAGFVDAITGEGLYYALRSADLLAEAIVNQAPESYAQRVKTEILPELELASRIADRFYSGAWLGGPVVERMVSLNARSTRFCEIMRDLFAGRQEYAGLKRRVHRSLPRIVGEALLSSVWRPRKNIEEAVAVG
jgi:flavin-dependent dehydrogenase